MKFIVRWFLFLALPLLVLASCSRKNKNKAAGYIPADASAVIAVNASQLMTKLAQEGVNYQKIYNMLLGGDEDTTTKPGVFWPGAATSGIDMEQPIYLALSIPSKITDKNAIIRIILSLKDAAQFAKTQISEDAEIKKEGDITIATMDESAFGYNNKTAVYIAHLNADAITGTKVTGVFGADTALGEQADFSGKMAADLIRETFKLEKDKSLASNNSFDEMPLDKNDMKVWLNYSNGVAGMLKGDASTAALVLEPLMKNSFTSAVLNFENGRIKGNSKMYFEKDAAEAIKKSAVRNIDLSATNTFPGTQLNGFAGFAFDPATIRYILEYVKWDGNANLALSLIGLKMDDLISCFSGDVSVLFSDARINELEWLSPLSIFDQASWAALAKINNREALDKILANSKVTETIKKEGDTYNMNWKGGKIYFNIKDKQLFAGSNPQLLAQFMAGTAKNNFETGSLARFKEKPAGLYLSPGNSPGNNPKSITGIIMGSLREMYLTGGRFEKNYLQSDIEIITANKNQNSLAAVFTSAFAYMQQQMTTMMKEAGEDDMPPLKPMQIK
jgi:Domain of unknown function (DUF4836)